MEKQNRYYYNNMSREERSAYEAMHAGFTALSPAIRLRRLPGKTLGDIFFRLRLDEPEIFYVKSCGYRWVQDAEYIELIPEYMFDRSKIKEHQRAVVSRLEKLVRPAKALTELERERFVHDFICSSVKYDKLKKSYSHEIIGPLQNGVGVCEGIAKTVKLMCASLGLDCLVAVSEADPSREEPYLHAWNVVCINGKYMHLDATFDNTLGGGGETRYDYFNLDDTHIFRDHRPLLYPMPACACADEFYYRRAGLSFTKPEELERRCSQAIRKKRDSFIFHWRGGYLTHEKLLELSEIIDTAARSAQRGVRYSVNWAQAVVKLTFTQAPVALQIETECADEA